jgi:hypothetical protein
MMNMIGTYQMLTYPSERNMVMEMLQKSRSATTAKSRLLAIHHVVGKTRRKSVRKLGKINK